MIELRCPESCHYLNAARTEMGQREGELRGKELLEEGRAPHSLSRREMRLVDVAFDAIVESHRGLNGPSLGDLVDSEILEALENALNNIETESSGIIYEHPASTPRIEDVSRRIREALDELAKSVPADSRPKRSEMIAALKFARDESQAHIKRNKEDRDSRSFLRFVALYVPWPEEESGSLIVMP